MRILIVDDSRLARIVLTRIVGALRPDWVCMEAPDAEDASGVLERQPANAAILDFNLPGKSGLVLARKLRSLFPSTPIAIATANVQD